MVHSLPAGRRLLKEVWPLLVAVSVFMMAATAWADDSCQTAGDRPQDELWLVETRHLSCGLSADQFLDDLRVWQLGPDNLWQTSSTQSLLAAEPMQTVVWVHGNWVDRDFASTRGVYAYRSLVKRNADPQVAVRFIIWSWPTSRVRGLVNDARIKAERSDIEGLRLAMFLDRLDPQTPLGLIGFSFGSRVITGALHLLGNGSLGGYQLSERMYPEGRTPARVVLLAAAMHNYWLLPGEYHGRAMSQVEHLLAVNNGCDSALKRYRVLGCGDRPEALGYCGLASPYLLGEDLTKFQQIDACAQVGREHSNDLYFCSRYLMSLAWQNLFEKQLAPAGD